MLSCALLKRYKMAAKKNIEFIDAQQERSEIKGLNIKGVFDGSWLASLGILKHLPFVIYLVVLTLMYIANRYHAERIIRKTTALREEVKNIRAEQITTSSELMNLSKPSNVEDLIQQKELGLEMPKEPAKKIVIKR